MLCQRKFDEFFVVVSRETRIFISISRFFAEKRATDPCLLRFLAKATGKAVFIGKPVFASIFVKTKQHRASIFVKSKQHRALIFVKSKQHRAFIFVKSKQYRAFIFVKSKQYRASIFAKSK